MHALFLCSQNRLRSPTAEQVFSSWPGVETDSAGLGTGADVPLSADQLEWADIIFVMEKVHKVRLAQKFKPYLNGKRVICLDIPDVYKFMQPELIQLLEKKVSKFLR
ncbi:low molecular weight protein tyrosine phosphatase family protein [Leeia oryzae]|uniref:low molecular weight protein tyrosine phosphatase family protein n=1 Tax=Leeia oryzae TaxID=356662 RepID=UPI00037B9531|nr:low molecular weight protein tyrosine phosphatase family protein [Leeia oryzae]